MSEEKPCSSQNSFPLLPVISPNLDDSITVVTDQPTFPCGWVRSGRSGRDCPPNLVCLLSVDELVIKHEFNILEVITGFESSHKYSIRNKLGEKLMYATETSDCCERFCCGSSRSFNLKLFDITKKEVASYYRPLACNFPGCLQSIEASAPFSKFIGLVQQQWKFFGSKFVLKNEHGDSVLRVQGPCHTFSCCDDVDFIITSEDGNRKIGKISKKWGGLNRECCTEFDIFHISFPIDLDVKVKAIVLGACFLIDYMYFEVN